MPATTTAQFFEEQARATKSYRLAVYLADHDVTVDRASRAHLDRWHQWALDAGTHDPSALTCDLVLDLLGHILDLRAALVGTDPFAGLPS